MTEVIEYLPREYLSIMVPIIIGIMALQGVLILKKISDKDMSGKISDMEKALKSEWINETSKQYIAEGLTRHLFYKAMNIDCAAEIHQPLLAMRAKMHNILNDGVYRHAAEFIVRKEEGIEIKVSRGSGILFSITQILSFALLLVAIACLLIWIFSLMIPAKEINHDALMLWFILLMIAILNSWTALDVAAALILKFEMNRIHQKNQIRDKIVIFILKRTPTYSVLYK